MALADQYAHRDLGVINPAIYRIARSSSYHRAFHDITTDIYGTGVNGYPATPGWDPVTGWGTPNAQELIPLLASFAKPALPASSPTPPTQVRGSAIFSRTSTPRCSPTASTSGRAG